MFWCTSIPFVIAAAASNNRCLVSGLPMWYTVRFTERSQVRRPSWPFNWSTSSYSPFLIRGGVPWCCFHVHVVWKGPFYEWSCNLLSRMSVRSSCQTFPEEIRTTEMTDYYFTWHFYRNPVLTSHVYRNPVLKVTPKREGVSSGYGEYGDVSKSFRTGHLERELQMVQLSATRCSSIAILWVSLVSFAVITLCVKNRDSSASILLGYGLDDRDSRVRFPAGAGNFSHHRIQNGPGAHPASYPMGTRGSFPGDKAAGAWSWPLTSI
jgi:hypothetical protein